MNKITFRLGKDAEALWKMIQELLAVYPKDLGVSGVIREAIRALHAAKVGKK